MGDPRAGQIVDNIFVSIQQIQIAGDVVASAGDWLILSSTPSEGHVLASATSDGSDLAARNLVQTRVDIDTTGLTDRATVVECLAAPSYVYAVAGGAIPAGAIVKLDTTGQKFLVASATDLAAGYVVGRFSRLSTDSAGNNDAVDTDIIILKLGVN